MGVENLTQEQQIYLEIIAAQYPVVPRQRLIDMILKFVNTFDSEFERFIMAESGYYA